MSSHEDGPKPLDSQAYSEHRKILIQGWADQSTAFDKYLLTLASGSFGLSILFMKEVGKPSGIGLLFVVVAWCGFGLSILFTLLSFLFSQFAFEDGIRCLDAAQKDEPACPKAWGIAVTVLNVTSIVFFTLGALFFTIFASLTISCKP